MFAEDPTEYFDNDDFAVIANLNNEISLLVIFDRAHMEQLNVFAGTDPVALCVSEDLGADPVGKTLTINSDVYIIRAVEPQDDGAISLLKLELT